MGKKKRENKAKQPWCFYCEREFKTEEVLIDHQKAKHFKCHVCHKKMYSGPGLVTHCRFVHKEELTEVPNSLPGREDVTITVFGMTGIPAEFDRDREEAEPEEPPAQRPRLDENPHAPPGGPAAYGGYPPVPMAGG